MATNKSPKRRYKPGKVIAGGHLPLPLREKEKTATKALMALAALRDGGYNSDVGMDLILFLTACKKLVENNQEALALLLTAFRAINAIKDRHTRTGKWVPTGDELRGLQETVPAFIDMYSSLTRDEAIEAKMHAEERLRSTLRKILDK